MKLYFNNIESFFLICFSKKFIWLLLLFYSFTLKEQRRLLKLVIGSVNLIVLFAVRFEKKTSDLFANISNNFI